MSEGHMPAMRRRFTTRRLLGMVALFAVAFALLTNFGTGSAPVFFLGSVGSATLCGAAIGVPFDRTVRYGLLGATLGVAFFLYALAT